MAKEADMTEAPIDEPDKTNCCLPHCDVPGERLDCNHLLCGQDLLKLARFNSQFEQFVVTCPMCRTKTFVERQITMRLMNDLPFRCALFNCGCGNPTCGKFTMVALRPCMSHKTYLCEVCKDLGTKGSHIRCVVREDDMETHDNAPDNVYTAPGWGMTDPEFEQVLQAIRQQTGATDVALRRIREQRRTGHASDPSWDPYEGSPETDLTPAELEELMNRPLRFDMNNLVSAMNGAVSRASRRR